MVVASEWRDRPRVDRWLLAERVCLIARAACLIVVATMLLAGYVFLCRLETDFKSGLRDFEKECGEGAKRFLADIDEKARVRSREDIESAREEERRIKELLREWKGTK